MIRAATTADAEAIAAIYNWYIENSHHTFEEDVLSVQDMALRIETVGPLSPWFVMEQDGGIVGYTYAAAWKPRAAYRFTRETSVYLHREYFAQGRGRKLYQHLIDELSNTPIHVLIAGIALPNEGSIALHESLGFNKIGQFHEVGFKYENYIDVGYWQLTL
ncbi:MAG: N-acetyltransferase family protein [Pseudohongiella sp.]|nr:N-acetyltransferase family protein [Pseudohongiella sp.]